MKNRVDRNRASAARIVRALDEAALRLDDATLLLRLGRLRNLALDSRTDSPSAPRSDRRTLVACRRLNQRLLDGAALWELPGVLAEIERGLFDRERRPAEESPLYEQKRRLFDRLRATASEMDALALRRRELVAAGADAREPAPSDALRRDEFAACGRRLALLQAEYRRTSAALQAMVSVHLLRSEEAMLDSLERDCASLPDLAEAERLQDRLELRAEALNRRAAAMLDLRGQGGEMEGISAEASSENNMETLNRRAAAMLDLRGQGREMEGITAEASSENNVDMPNCRTIMLDLRKQDGKMGVITAEDSPENNMGMPNCSAAVCDLRKQGGEMEGVTAGTSPENNVDMLNCSAAVPDLRGQGGETEGTAGEASQVGAATGAMMQGGGGADGSAVRADGRGFGAAGHPGEPVRNVVLPPRFSSERFRTMILSRLREKNPE